MPEAGGGDPALRTENQNPQTQSCELVYFTDSYISTVLKKFVCDTVVYLFHIPPFPPEAQRDIHEGPAGRAGPAGPGTHEQSRELVYFTDSYDSINVEQIS